MNLPMRSFGPALLVAMAACGGRVIDLGDPGAGGAGGGASTAVATTSGSGATGSTGPSSGTGSTGSTGSTGPSSGTGSTTFSTTGTGTTVTTGATTGGGGSSIDPVPAASCEGVCSRAVNNGCFVGGYEECVSSCYEAWKSFPQCSMQFDQYLQCLAMNPLDCTSGNAVARFCEWAYEPYAKCTSGGGAPIDAGTPQCASVPRMPGPMVCSGGGSSTAATSGGGPSRPQCSRQCTDANKNTWTAECVGNSCACWMNGRQVCQCTTAGSSCAQFGDCCPF